MEIVNGLIAECERDAENLAQALKSVSGGVVGNALRTQVEEVEKRYAALLAEQESLQQALSSKTLTDENIAAARQFREDVLAGLQNPTFEDKRRAMEMLQVEVTIHDRRARVKCLIPTEESVIDLQMGSRLCRWEAITGINRRLPAD